MKGRSRLSQRGFSLLEVVVAFAVLALSLGALYQSVGGSVRGMQGVEQRTQAVLLAQSLLTLYDTVPQGGGVSEGRSAGGLTWQIETRPEEVLTESNAWPLYRVEVRVWGNARQPPLFSVASLRPERDVSGVAAQ